MEKALKFELRYSANGVNNVITRSKDFSNNEYPTDDIIDIVNNFYGLLIHSAYDLEDCLDIIWEMFFEKSIIDNKEEYETAFKELKEEEAKKPSDEAVDIYADIFNSVEHYDSFKKQLVESENLNRLMYRLYLQHIMDKG